MSSVSSVNRPDLTQVQRGSGGAVGRPGFQPPKELREQFQSRFDAAAKELGIDSSQFAAVGGKIQEALGKIDLASSSDPQATIERTVNDTLKASGVDAEKFKADFAKILDKLGPPGGEGGLRPGGFDGSGGVGSRGIASYAQSTQSDAIQQLLSSLSGDEEEASGSRIAGFLAKAGAGTFVDTAA